VDQTDSSSGTEAAFYAKKARLRMTHDTARGMKGKILQGSKRNENSNFHITQTSLTNAGGRAHSTGNNQPLKGLGILKERKSGGGGDHHYGMGQQETRTEHPLSPNVGQDRRRHSRARTYVKEQKGIRKAGVQREDYNNRGRRRQEN